MNIRKVRHVLLTLITVFVVIVSVFAFMSDRWTISTLYEDVADLNPGWTMVTPSPAAKKGTIALERFFSPSELQGIAGGPTLFFRTFNASVVVRVNGNYIYSYGLLGKTYVGSECGSALHFFRLSHFFQEGSFLVNIEFSPAFQGKENGFFKRGVKTLITPKIYFGSKAACLQKYVMSCFFPAAVAIIVILMGLMHLILTGTFWLTHRQYVRNFCYWGIFSLVLGIGFLLESGLADLIIPQAFVRYFAITFVLAILPEFFLMYVRTSKVVSYNLKLSNFFIAHSIFNSVLVCVFAFIPSIPFSYVRTYIIICHAMYLFFLIAMFVNNSVELSKAPTIPSVFVIISAVSILIDFTLYLVPPYRDDIFMISRYIILFYLLARTVEIINDFFSTQILSAREDLYRTVVVRDYLTGVMSRPAFWRFQKDFFKKNVNINDRLTLVLCEIINLKDINIQNGYEDGDEILKTTSQILKLHFSQENVYRITGSCFAVLLLDVSQETIQQKIVEIKKIVDDYNSNLDLGNIRLAMADNVYSTYRYPTFDKFLTQTVEKLSSKRHFL